MKEKKASAPEMRSSSEEGRAAEAEEKQTRYKTKEKNCWQDHGETARLCGPTWWWRDEEAEAKAEECVPERCHLHTPEGMSAEADAPPLPIRTPQANVRSKPCDPTITDGACGRRACRVRGCEPRRRTAATTIPRCRYWGCWTEPRHNTAMPSVAATPSVVAMPSVTTTLGMDKDDGTDEEYAELYAEVGKLSSPRSVVTEQHEKALCRKREEDIQPELAMGESANDATIADAEEVQDTFTEERKCAEEESAPTAQAPALSAEFLSAFDSRIDLAAQRWQEWHIDLGEERKCAEEESAPTAQAPALSAEFWSALDSRIDLAAQRWPEWRIDLGVQLRGKYPKHNHHDFGKRSLKRSARIDFFRGRDSDDRMNTQWVELLEELPKLKKRFEKSHGSRLSPETRGNVMETVVGIAYAVETSGMHLSRSHLSWSHHRIPLTRLEDDVHRWRGVWDLLKWIPRIQPAASRGGEKKSMKEKQDSESEDSDSQGCNVEDVQWATEKKKMKLQNQQAVSRGVEKKPDYGSEDSRGTNFEQREDFPHPLPPPQHPPPPHPPPPPPPPPHPPFPPPKSEEEEDSQSGHEEEREEFMQNNKAMALEDPHRRSKSSNKIGSFVIQ